MSYDEVLEYLFLDNIAQWHFDWYPSGRYYKPEPREDIDTKKINDRIKELQQKFLKDYICTDNDLKK